jgi:D-alanyl-D-alanine dipeptidase
VTVLGGWPHARLRRAPALLAAAALAACASGKRAPASPVERAIAPNDTFPLRPPAPPPARWLPLIGEYGPDSAPRLVLERGGHVALLVGRKGTPAPMNELSDGVFTAADGSRVVFSRAADGRPTSVTVGWARLARRQVGPESGNQLLVPPVRPIAELRREALAATPPVEQGTFRAPELVELTRLDPTIKLEIRYATSNNLFGTPFYSEARAFLQRPAAEALVRVSAALRTRGYGLLVHDGYRPWYVTKMFWDASPPDKHIFVADPAQGSRHNRGCAVDLTLYDLATGAPVEMVSTYDETSPRAYPDYPGGTSRQRWHRELLRRAMEAERFTVYEAEWWHFDYADWRQYPILNVAFDKIPAVGQSAR